MDEKVVALVAPTDLQIEKYGHDIKELESEMRAHLNILAADLAQYKRPQEIIVRREAFPMTASLKIKRHLLRDELLRRPSGVHESL
jgi:acyl-coenzyme A synthetase/AMP-(fatty) acid ligase